MNAGKMAIILAAAVALIALLGCVEQPGSGPKCTAEGGTIPVIAQPPECCAGLALIPPKDPNLVGIMGYCTAKCGNGTCDTVSESEHNCPADCAVEARGEQVIGPEYYESEEEAFDALNEELNDMPQLSDEELESMLGQ